MSGAGVDIDRDSKQVYDDVCRLMAGLGLLLVKGGAAGLERLESGARADAAPAGELSQAPGTQTTAKNRHGKRCQVEERRLDGPARDGRNQQVGGLSHQSTDTT